MAVCMISPQSASLGNQKDTVGLGNRHRNLIHRAWLDWPWSPVCFHTGLSPSHLLKIEKWPNLLGYSSRWLDGSLTGV